MKKTIFIVDYAYGFHADTCEVDYVCRLRCLAALRALKKYPEARIVLGAGMRERTGDCGPLADMMENFLQKHGVSGGKIERNPQGHDTLSETEAVYKLIQKRGGDKIVCATSAYHVPRVWLIWLFQFGVTPEMYATKLKPHFSEQLKEIFKIPRDAIRALIRRFLKG